MHFRSGDCTQTQFCLSGGYMLPIEGGDCVHACAPATTAASTLNGSGMWSDVDYADRTSSVWKPTLHLERTFAMARSLRCDA
jgi:hypothetical protein